MAIDDELMRKLKLPADLMLLDLVSIDATWSAFSLRSDRPGETRQAVR